MNPEKILEAVVPWMALGATLLLCVAMLMAVVLLGVYLFDLARPLLA